MGNMKTDLETLKEMLERAKIEYSVNEDNCLIIEINTKCSNVFLFNQFGKLLGVDTWYE